MANNPNAAADMARCMAEALAATGASADEIAATMQEALNMQMNNIDPDHLEELLGIVHSLIQWQTGFQNKISQRNYVSQ